MKPLVRRMVYRGLRSSGLLAVKRAWHGWRGDGWATVLVFHRLGEPARDGLTIQLARFRRILELLRATYRVLPLRELVSRVHSRATFTGRDVAITFDDGYRDNYEVAAPLLQQFGLPACFFLTVGYIGTERRFPWDEQRGVTCKLMTWEQSRELQQQGFEIGCHTWSHADLGATSTAHASRELSDARSFMEDKLGSQVVHFAYPFGEPENITPEWVDAVADAGFISNFSAHGGVVTPGVSPYAIPRTNASYQPALTELRIDMDRPW